MMPPFRVALLVVGALAIASPVHAQPKIPLAQIPTGLGAERAASFRKLYSTTPLVRAHGAGELHATPEAIPFLVSMLDDNAKYTEVFKTKATKGVVGSEVSRTTSDTPLGRTTTIVTAYSGYEELPKIYVFAGTPSADAANSLGTIGKPAIEPMLRGLEARPERFMRVCQAIHMMPRDDVECIPPFMQRLKHEHKVVRWAAVVGLHHYVAKVNVKEVFVPLKADKSAYVRQEAMAALGSALEAERKTKKDAPLNAEFVGVLVEALVDDAPFVRAQALRSLQHAKGNQIAPAVAKLAADADMEVRIQVVYALRSLKDPATIPTFVELATDKKADVRKVAVRALSDLDDPRASAAMLVAVKDKDISVRESAAQMHKIPNDEVAKALVSLLGDPTANVRILANNNLLAHANALTVPHLVTMVRTDKNAQIRTNAINVLQNLAKRNVPEAKAAMQKLQGK